MYFPSGDQLPSVSIALWSVSRVVRRELMSST